MKKSALPLLLIPGLASAGWATANHLGRSLQIDEYCADDEEQAVFDLYLDSTPDETGWKLVCDDDNGNAVWDSPVGSLSLDLANSWVSETACISKESTCTMTIYDGAGDGFAEDGWYALRYGATTVAVYNYQGENEPFSEDTFCFGPECEELPLERAEDQEQQAWEDDIIPEDEDPVPDEDQSPTTSTTPEESDSSDNTNKIVGGILGIVLGLIVLIGVAALISRSRKREYASFDDSPPSIAANEKNSDKADETKSATSSSEDDLTHQGSGETQDDLESVDVNMHSNGENEMKLS